MSALNEQPGGTHYKQMAIQPVQYIHANGLGYCEGNVIKYVSRWREKNGLQDLLKARHYIDLLIELEGLEKAEFGQQNTIDCRTNEERAADIGRQLADGVRRAASGAVCNDPRTVVGLDVSFPTEKHMNFAPEQEAGEWVEWKGGSMPVAGTARVDIRTRDAGECFGVEAEEWLWGHSETGEDEGDIVAYRISAEASHA